MRYQFISGETSYTAAKWAQYLKVSLSGYSEWKKNRSKREERQVLMIDKVRRILEDSHGTYGADKICGILRHQGHKASFPRVRVIMNQENLHSVHEKRRARSLTDSGKARVEGYGNLVRGKETIRPFQVLPSDISYIRTGEGFEYLCQIRDVCSGVVISWSMSNRMKAELVEEAVRRACKNWLLPRGSIFHSGRGSQYTSSKVKELLVRQGFCQSFSRAGLPGDNAWSESFFAALKKEQVHWAHFATRKEVREAIFEYIEGFYNTKRVQERLGCLSPLQRLNEWYRTNRLFAA